jgi:hypothetical protein
MDLLRRINPFWLAAGLLLTWFGLDELIAFHVTRVPRWLGGPIVHFGEVVVTLAGLVVLYTLAIEEKREPGDFA